MDPCLAQNTPGMYVRTIKFVIRPYTRTSVRTNCFRMYYNKLFSENILKKFTTRNQGVDSRPQAFV